MSEAVGEALTVVRILTLAFQARTATRIRIRAVIPAGHTAVHQRSIRKKDEGSYQSNGQTNRQANRKQIEMRRCFHEQGEDDQRGEET